MAVKTSHAPLFPLLLCLFLLMGLVLASGLPGPYIHTPPSDSCKGGSAKHGSSEILGRRSPPCRRPRLQNQEDISHATVP